MKKRAPLPDRIVISHVYSHANKGDAALTCVLIQDLRRRFPDATLHILTLESTDPTCHFEGVLEQPGFMHYALHKYRRPFKKLAYVLYMIPATFVWAVCRRAFGIRLPLPLELRTVVDLYDRADLVVAVGGGYIRSRNGLVNRLNVPLVLHPLLFSYLLRKPTVLYSQSIGPFMHAYEQSMAAFVLKRMNLVMLREDISKTLLTGMGVRQNVIRTVDCGFLLHSEQASNVRKTYGISARKLLIGVTVRAWLDPRAQYLYEVAIAKALDDIIKIFGARVLFIPQVTAQKGDDDREVARRIHDLMARAKAATLIDEELDHRQIKAIYDDLDVLLGTRFHSVIFSLTGLVPVLAIEYEHKTSGIMHDLKLEKWTIRIEEVSSYTLTQLMVRLIRSRHSYRDHLKRHLPAYIRRAEKNADLLARAYLAASTARAGTKRLNEPAADDGGAPS